ncbi:2,4-dienoyl-CoA reductase-like NADH-dependent reductase (Old Yellow Enzyme family) [Oxalobacteraceae bacterium GrIS 1.18]
MTNFNPRIHSTFDLKGVQLQNRLAVAPMTRVSATAQGLPTQAMAEYYHRFAQGGFGLVFSEGLYTDQAFSQGYLNQPGMTDDAQARAWSGITAALHARGTRMFAQLMHAGALSQGNRFRKHTVGPSAVQPKGLQMSFYHGEGRYPMPLAISAAELAEAIEGFVQSAARAVRLGGFDGVEIHGANGYLLDQFLTEELNLRTDRWGGDVARRVSLLVEVVKAVKAELKGSAPVGIRISQGKVNDFTSKWSGGEADAKTIFCALAEANVDFIHVTEFEAWQPAFAGGKDSLLTLARRYAPHVAIVVNGSLHEIDRSEEALANGADVVALGRGALANPDLPQVFGEQRVPRAFNAAILGPIANIKSSELAFSGSDK